METRDRDIGNPIGKLFSMWQGWMRGDSRLLCDYDGDEFR
jgi:hypothetical protein